MDHPHKDAEKEDLQPFDRAEVNEEKNTGKWSLTSQSTHYFTFNLWQGQGMTKTKE